MDTEELREIIANARENMAEDEPLPTLARKVIAAEKLVEALPRWIEAMGDWDKGGEQAIEEMQSALAAWEAAQ